MNIAKEYSNACGGRVCTAQFVEAEKERKKEREREREREKEHRIYQQELPWLIPSQRMLG
jgi:hypothetical protein